MNSSTRNEYIEISPEAYQALTGDERSGGATQAATVLPEQRPSWFSSLELSQVLRWCGGILLGTAGIAFMFQGVYSVSPMTRHWMMLATCVLLALLGGVTGSLMKETKGARTFFGFATASFPVLASQMGAMIFSLFGHPPEGMPQPLVFSLPNLGAVSAIVLLTMTIASSISYFGFRILGRSKAALLTALYSFANIAILLPAREGVPAGLLIVVVAAVIYWFDNTQLRKDFRMENFEGRVCRIMINAPLLVMIGRNLFYPLSAGYVAVVMAAIGIYLSFHWGRNSVSTVARGMFQLAGLGAMTTAWFVYIAPSMNHFAFGEGAALYLMLLPIAVMAGLQSLPADTSLARIWQLSAVAIGVTSVLTAHLIDGASVVSIIGILVALAVIALGVLAGERWIAFAGCAAALTSLGNVAMKAVAYHANYTWGMLAAVGILVLFGASMAERGRGGLHQKVMSLWGRLGG